MITFSFTVLKWHLEAKATAKKELQFSGTITRNWSFKFLKPKILHALFFFFLSKAFLIFSCFPFYDENSIENWEEHLSNIVPWSKPYEKQNCIY